MSTFYLETTMADFLSPSSNQIISRSHCQQQQQQQQPTEDDDDDGNNASNNKEQHLQLKFREVVVGIGASSSSSSLRKPRGRPPGSKNKPKPPVVITKESESAMHPMFLEISPGTDILDAVSDFARRRGAAVSVLACSGPVSNVSLRHPTVHSSAITLSGRFEILSLSGTFMPAASTKAPSPFTVSLAGAQGQVIGGMVVGPLMSAGPVMLTAASFVTPEFYRLPVSGGDQEEQLLAAASRDEDVKVEVVYSRAGPTAALSTGTHQHGHHEVVLWGAPAVSPATAPRAPPPHSHRPPPAHY